MKNQKLISLILALIVSISATMSAYAVSAEPFDGLPESELYSTTADKVSLRLADDIRSCGVALDEDSIISIVTSSNQNTALMITNKEGTTVTKDILVSVGEDGITDVVPPQSSGGISPMSGYTGELRQNSNTVVRATAVYTQYTDKNGHSFYYRPLGATLTYQKIKSCSVTFISVDYVTTGWKRATSKLEAVSSDLEEYLIHLEKSSPTENVLYGEDNYPYPSGYAICCDGYLFAGQEITIRATVNNSNYNDSFLF